MLFTLVFGYLHQGGVLPTLFKLNHELSQPRLPFLQASNVSQPLSSGSPVPKLVEEVNIVFWKTFMPPRHLLLPLVSGELDTQSKFQHSSDLDVRLSLDQLHRQDCAL